MNPVTLADLIRDGKPAWVHAGLIVALGAAVERL
jgi:hypothetical protein